MVQLFSRYLMLNACQNCINKHHNRTAWASWRSDGDVKWKRSCDYYRLSRAKIQYIVAHSIIFLSFGHIRMSVYVHTCVRVYINFIIINLSMYIFFYFARLLKMMFRSFSSLERHLNEKRSVKTALYIH